MRVRKLTPKTNDFQFGGRANDFWIDQPEAVAQIVRTRLSLWLGDWFLDTTDGMDWKGSVLGNRTVPTRDPTIRVRVLETPGVTGIRNYAATVDSNTRTYSVQFELDTQFGPYGILVYEFITPAPTPQLVPPPPPENVVVTQTGDSAVGVVWAV